MTGAGGELEEALPALDDTALKMMFVSSIMITILGIIGIVHLFRFVRAFQEKRSVLFDELTQLDKIDYLIHLFEESEKIYKLRGNTNSEAQENLNHFLELLHELSDQLDELHDMTPDVDYNGRPREKKKE
jgi:hypothetical protein